MTEHATLSHKELDRLQILTRLAEKRLTQRQAGELMGVTERQVRRIYRAFQVEGAAALTSRQRRRSNLRRLPQQTRDRALELVREHAWFEDRGPACTLLVYVDDATSNLMELRFAESESTFDYFAATRSYLGRHGRPMAFYSDRLSVFHVARGNRAIGARILWRIKASATRRNRCSC
jgi:hypothetical protein